MNEGISYIVKKIEKNYYKKNPNLLISGKCCMKEESENLQCNCITGIMLNYAGYIIKNCLHKQECEAKYTVDNNIAYIKISYNQVEAFPIMMNYIDTKRYHFTHMMCRKGKKSDQQAYIKFRCYRSINEISEEVENYQKNNMRNLSMKETYYIEFWIRLLSALRVKKLEQSSKAFLSMAIFMFPGKTLKLIKDEIAKHNDIEWKKKLIDFLCEYLDFLKKIGNPEQGFFFKFSNAYESLTQIKVRNFIENEVKESCELMIETLQSACKSNADEVNRRSGKFRAILKEILKSQGDLDKEMLNKFSAKIDDLDNMYTEFNLGKAVGI